MNRAVFLLILAAGLSGCIKLQMPDDLVSDTVDVIRGSDDDEPADDSSNDASTFSHSVVGAADAPVADLMASCLAEVESRIAEQFGEPDISFTVISENVSIRGDRAIATCTVSVK